MLRKSLVLTVSLLVLFSTQLLFARSEISLSAKSFDLGSVEEGKESLGKIAVSNLGDSNLEVSSSTDCGCVKVVEPPGKFVIIPGETKNIKFSFDTSGYSGRVKREMVLNTNDIKNPIVIVNVFCNVSVKSDDLASRMKSLSIWMVVATGLGDSINPCAFTVLVFFMSFLAFIGYKRKKIFLIGGIFILIVFLTYLLIGLGIFNAFKSLGVYYILQILITFFTMLFAFILAGLNIFDYVIYKKTNNPEKTILKLPGIIKQKIHGVIRDNVDTREKTGHIEKTFIGIVISTVVCAFLVTLLESVCTGQMYLPIIVFLTVSAPTKLLAIYYLILYNLMFVLPLAAIVILSGFGISSDMFSKIALKNLGKVKIATALIFLLLAIALLIWKRQDFLYLFTFLF